MKRKPPPKPLKLYGFTVAEVVVYQGEPILHLALGQVYLKDPPDAVVRLGQWLGAVADWMAEAYPLATDPALEEVKR